MAISMMRVAKSRGFRVYFSEDEDGNQYVKLQKTGESWCGPLASLEKILDMASNGLIQAPQVLPVRSWVPVLENLEESLASLAIA
jgi:hypothetical protein